MNGKFSDKRLKIISDIINGIRTIKAYAWERSFEKLVSKHRKPQIRYIYKLEIMDSIMWVFGACGGYIMAIAMFGYHYGMDREFNYEKSLAAIGICSYLSLQVFWVFFASVRTYSTFAAVLARVGEVLDMEEKKVDGK